VDSYSNTAYDILGLIIEQLSGMPYEQYIRQKVLPKIRVAQSETEIGKSFQQTSTRASRSTTAGDEPQRLQPAGRGCACPTAGGTRTRTLGGVADRVERGLMNWPRAGISSGRTRARSCPTTCRATSSTSTTGASPGRTQTSCTSTTRRQHRRRDHRQPHGELRSRAVHPPQAAFLLRLPATRLVGLAQAEERGHELRRARGRRGHRAVLPGGAGHQRVRRGVPSCSGFNGDFNGDNKVDASDIPGSCSAWGTGMQLKRRLWAMTNGRPRTGAGGRFRCDVPVARFRVRPRGRRTRSAPRR
jgi:CubicO group peptidase (beta-lactamase class C family)